MDPNLDSDYTKTLMNICPNGGDPNKLLEMDPGSSTNFDTKLFQNCEKTYRYVLIG